MGSSDRITLTPPPPLDPGGARAASPSAAGGPEAVPQSGMWHSPRRPGHSAASFSSSSRRSQQRPPSSGKTSSGSPSAWGAGERMIGGGRFASWEERETTEYDWDGDAESRSGSVEMNCVNRRSLMGGGLVIGGGAHLANANSSLVVLRSCLLGC